MPRGDKRLASRAGDGQTGFTLVELLVVVAFISLIVGMLVPNLLGAVQKAKQKRTMNDITMLGKGWMNWITDQLSAGAAGSSQTVAFRWTDMDPITYPVLHETLIPTYANVMPEKDAWNRPYQFGGAGIETDFPIAVRSQGGDDLWDGDDYTTGAFAISDFSMDIVWAAGYFIRWPEGLGPHE